MRQWIIEACKEYGITATIEGSLDLKLNLTQMADGFSGQEHSLPIMPLYKDVVQFVARTKTFYTPTILVAYGAPWTENYWFENENPDKRYRSCGGGFRTELLDTMIAAARAVVPARRVRPHEARASRWPTSSTPAAARGSAATGRCRGSARIGKPGTSAPAG